MISVWIFACFLLCFNATTSACVHNDCDCSGNAISCGQDDMLNPQFTDAESFYATHLTLTGSQYGLLAGVCGRLPNLASITFEGTYNGDRCPTVKCVRVICR